MRPLIYLIILTISAGNVFGQIAAKTITTRDSCVTDYYDNGKKKSETIYYHIDSGKLYAPLSYVLMTWYETGVQKLFQEGILNDGAMLGSSPFHGQYITWHPSGLLKSIELSNGSTYKFMSWYDNNKIKMSVDKGNAEGMKTGWYENGIKHYEIPYLKDATNGLVKMWFDNGQIQYKGMFVNGKMNGVFLKFDIKGKIIAKGTYKDNKLINGVEVKNYDFE